MFILHEHHFTCHFNKASSKLILFSRFIYFFGLPFCIMASIFCIKMINISEELTLFSYKALSLHMPRIWLPCLYIIPTLQSTPTFALHLNAPGISSCHSWAPHVFTPTAKKFIEKWVFNKYSVLATVQTKSKVASWRTGFHPLSQNKVNSSHW